MKKLLLFLPSVIFLLLNCGEKIAGPEEGKLKWEMSLGWRVISSPAIVNNGTIYVGSYNDSLYSITSSGIKRWAFGTEGSIISSPAVGSDGIVYIGSSYYNLYAINPDGTEKWKFETEGDIEASPAIGVFGTIYVASEDGSLYAIESSSSRLASSPWPMFHHDLRHSGRVNGP